MSTPFRILLSLAAGLALGALLKAEAPGLAARMLILAEPIGGMWLDALRMTIVPLVVALLVTGIASTASAAQAGGLAGRTVTYILIALWTSAVLGYVLTTLLIGIWPIPAEAGAALRAALADNQQSPPEVPGIGAFLRAIITPNIVRAAVEDQMLSLILFSGLFGFALTRLDDRRRATLTGFFDAVAAAMIVIVKWILWLAPIGVLALAFTVGARAGLQAAGALGHYVIILSAIGAVVTLLVYPAAALFGRARLANFARAVASAQALAVSTQSSLACLPIMLRAAEALGAPARTAGITLPMAVALFRCTGPAMNLGVALYVAHWFGVELSPAQIATGIALAATTTLGAVSLPGSISFISSIAPIALALGLPIEPLLLLVAIEQLPDIFRTLGNVTADVALARIVGRRAGNAVEPGAFPTGEAHHG